MEKGYWGLGSQNSQLIDVGSISVGLERGYISWMSWWKQTAYFMIEGKQEGVGRR